MIGKLFRRFSATPLSARQITLAMWQELLTHGRAAVRFDGAAVTRLRHLHYQGELSVTKWRSPLVIAASLLCVAGFLTICHSCSRFFTGQAMKASGGPQARTDLHAGLDVSIAEGIRVPTRDVIQEVKIGRLTVGKKKTGFIRLGSFNEVRLKDVDIVVTRGFCSPPVSARDNVASIEDHAAVPGASTSEGRGLPQTHPSNLPPPALESRPHTSSDDARLNILKTLKAHVNDYTKGAYNHGASISSFSIRGLRIILDDDASDRTVIIAAQQAKIEKDHIRLGPHGGVKIQTSWGDASIASSQAKITFSSSATIGMPTAFVRCGDSTMRYASLELPLDALVSRQAWDKHFQTASVN